MWITYAYSWTKNNKFMQYFPEYEYKAYSRVCIYVVNDAIIWLQTPDGL